MLAQALMVIGATTEAVGQISAGRATAAALKQKAALSQMEGREAKRISDYRVRLIHRAGAETMGAIEAETGKSGLAMSGTPLTSLIDTARDAELAAVLENRAGQISQQRYEQAADAYKKDAKAAKTAGTLGGLGSLANLGGMFS